MIIYKTTNTITGHFYIGQSARNDSSYLGSGVRLKFAIKKYGRENFIRETICECSSQEELDNMERYWIKKLDSKNPEFGYNLDCGGRRWNGLNGLTSEKISKSLSGRKFSESHKENIRKSKLGTKASEETKRKMSESKQGRKTWNAGITGYSTKKLGRKYGHNSLEHNQNISKGLTGRVFSKEHCEKISRAKLGKTYKRKSTIDGG